MSDRRHPDDSGENFDDSISPRVVLAKLEVHATEQRKGLEKLHEKQRANESGHAMVLSRVESLEGWRKVTMAIVSAVALAALGSLWTAYTAARDAGNRDGRVDTQIEALHNAVDKIESQIETLWRLRVRGAIGDQP